MAPKGKYFFIQTKLNDMVLDVSGHEKTPGTKVVTWPKKDSNNANQLWYEDHVTGTIRSKMCDLCLDINDDNALIINSFDKDHDSQQWLTAGDRIQSRGDPSQVLDVAANNADRAAKVCRWKAHDAANQKWNFLYQEAHYFYIVSKMHGKVLDIKKQSADPGAKVVLWDREADRASQLWYEDKHGVILNKINNFSLDSAGSKVKLQPFAPGNTSQLWAVQEDRIVNRTDPKHVLDIKDEKRDNGAKIISYAWHGSDNQRWTFEKA